MLSLPKTSFARGIYFVNKNEVWANFVTSDDAKTVDVRPKQGIQSGSRGISAWRESC